MSRQLTYDLELWSVFVGLGIGKYVLDMDARCVVGKTL